MAGKTPVTLSATERQSQLAKEGKIPAFQEPQAGARPTFTSEEVRQRLHSGRKDEFALAAARNLVPERFPKAAAGLKPGDEFDGATMTLESAKIKPYDRNPRRSINPNYEEIKEAIKVKGVLNQITVTKRPGTEDYMVYGGGNTRLKIVQELDRDYPGNPLYSTMQVVYRGWRGEADVIAAHLIENEARGDTTFWDKAGGLIALKRELETELGTSLSSNDVRLKAGVLGWKVSRETIQLYDFAIEFLSPIGPWLKYSAAQLLRERIGAFSAVMKQLDLSGGPTSFKAVLSEEQSRLSEQLKAAQETQILGPVQAEVDAVLMCTALEERVAAATGTSVPELRQMLAILATNPQASASQLRSEAAKGVVGARGTQKAPTDPVNVVPSTQIPLPTPMLAAVRPHAQEPPGVEPNPSGLSSGLPSIQDQGDLPPELAAKAVPTNVTGQGAANPNEAAAQASQALFEALQALAENTDNLEFFTRAPGMPLGYVMELPRGPLEQQTTRTLPPDQQIRLKRLMRAGWQLLATLSCQFDRRCCNERCLPDGSSWLNAVQSGGVSDALWRCGVTIHEGSIQLESDCLYYILTEPNLLSPAVLQALSALAVRRDGAPNLLPPHLELVTAAPATAA